MAPKRNPQMAFGFARPKRRKGGLEVDAYQELVTRLRRDAERIAAHFRLPAFELDADRPDARDRYGLCDDEGRILVRLVNVRTGRELKYSALIDTVVHELAHLRHLNHGPRWEALYERMLAWARAEGIYQPRASPGPAPPSSLAAKPPSPRPKARPSRGANSSEDGVEDLLQTNPLRPDEPASDDPQR